MNEQVERFRDTEMIRAFMHSLSVRASAKRAAGRHGWWNPEVISLDDLESMLRRQLQKDELDVHDIGLLAGMVWWRRIFVEKSEC